MYAEKGAINATIWAEGGTESKVSRVCVLAVATREADPLS